MATLIAEQGDRVRVNCENEAGTLKGRLGTVSHKFATGYLTVHLDGTDEHDDEHLHQTQVTVLISTKEFTALRAQHRLEGALTL